MLKLQSSVNFSSFRIERNLAKMKCKHKINNSKNFKNNFLLGKRKSKKNEKSEQKWRRKISMTFKLHKITTNDGDQKEHQARTSNELMLKELMGK